MDGSYYILSDFWCINWFAVHHIIPIKTEVKKNAKLSSTFTFNTAFDSL